MPYTYPFAKYAQSGNNTDPPDPNPNPPGPNPNPQGSATPIIDTATLNEFAGYATLPAMLAVISAFLTDKPAIPLALALAGLGAAHYIPWVKENINVMRWAEALFGGQQAADESAAENA